MPTDFPASPLHLLAPEAALKAAGISPSDSIEDRPTEAGIRRFEEAKHPRP